jgi:hypothetical protein
MSKLLEVDVRNFDPAYLLLELGRKHQNFAFGIRRTTLYGKFVEIAEE